jgi:hypothetical protein
VFFTWTAPYDSTYLFSGCGSGYDQVLMIFNNTCPTLPTDADLLGGNDDSPTCAPYSEVTLTLSAGQQVLIVVDAYGGNSGTYALNISAVVPPPPAPTCPAEGVIVGQSPTLPTDSWNFATSDAEPGYIAYENFAGLSAVITEVKFFGMQAFFDGSSWAGCSEDPAQLQINFYDDAGGIPGAMVQTYDVSVSPVPTGQSFSGFAQVEFDVTLPTPVSVFQGWISIQGTSIGDNCWFMWQDSPNGDFTSLQSADGGSTFTINAYDLSMCLIGTNFTPWLSIDPTTFDVVAGENTIINVNMNAAGLAVGVYNGAVHFSTNELSNPFHTVPVQMTVTGQGTIHGIAYNIAPPDVLPNVHVVTYDAGNVVVDDQISNALGIWNVALPPGTYRQHLSKPSFQDADINGIVVVAGGVANVSFNMQTGGVGCHYVIGDANGSGTYTGLDVTYSVRYFKGGPHPIYSCECTPGNTWYVAGDVNGSCTFTGLDVTYSVRYFKGGAGPIPCPSCPPTADILILSPKSNTGSVNGTGSGQ